MYTSRAKQHKGGGKALGKALSKALSKALERHCKGTAQRTSVAFPGPLLAFPGPLLAFPGPLLAFPAPSPGPVLTSPLGPRPGLSRASPGLYRGPLQASLWASPGPLLALLASPDLQWASPGPPLGTPGESTPRRWRNFSMRSTTSLSLRCDHC